MTIMAANALWRVVINHILDNTASTATHLSQVDSELLDRRKMVSSFDEKNGPTLKSLLSITQLLIFLLFVPIPVIGSPVNTTCRLVIGHASTTRPSVVK